jgi:hypothetical protein
MGDHDRASVRRAREADPGRARITELMRRAEPRDSREPVPLTDDEAAEVRAWHERQTASKAAQEAP